MKNIIIKVILGMLICALLFSGCVSQKQPDGSTESVASVQISSISSVEEPIESTDAIEVARQSSEELYSVYEPIEELVTSTSEETEQPSLFAEYKVPEEYVDIYWKEYFCYYTIEEYIDLYEVMFNSDVFSEYDIPDEWVEIYWKSFAPYYSIEKYGQLCLIMKEMSAEPRSAVNSNLFFATQDLSTYDKIYKKAILLNAAGNVVREYEDADEFSSASIPYFFNVGQYSFISTAVENYSEQKDVFSDTGEYIETYTIRASLTKAGTLTYTYDLGEGYYIFAPISSGNYNLYILHPTGAVYEMDAKEWGNLPYSLFEENSCVGTVSDSLFYVYFDEYGDKYAYYFDLYGQCALDLSKDVFPYEVHDVGDFLDGKATIVFEGVDSKEYSVAIDKHGEFIEEPIAN